MRAVRVIQTSAIAMLLVAASIMCCVAVSATERHHDDDDRAESYRKAIEYPHIHGKIEKRERPALHSDGTRYDDDYSSFDNDETVYTDSDEPEEDE